MVSGKQRGQRLRELGQGGFDLSVRRPATDNAEDNAYLPLDLGGVGDVYLGGDLVEEGGLVDALRLSRSAAGDLARELGGQRA